MFVVISPSTLLVVVCRIYDAHRVLIRGTVVDNSGRIERHLAHLNVVASYVVSIYRVGDRRQWPKGSIYASGLAVVVF